MRILFLTPEIPYPADDGGKIKTLSLLEYLHPRHDVRLFCFRRRALDPAQQSWADAFGEVTMIPLLRGRSLLGLVGSYLAGVPLSVWRNRSERLGEAIRGEAGSGQFDCAFVDHWLMAQYLPDAFDGLKLLHQHNAEYVMWRRQARSMRNPLLRLLVRREAIRVRRYEARILPLFDTVFAVSDADRRALIKIGGHTSRLRVLPNVPEPDLLERPALSFAGSEPVILYFGTLSWQPNIDGLEYFLSSVLPLVRARLPEVRLVLAGKGAAPGLVRLAERTQGVDFVGPVDDAEALYGRARVFIETTRSGGGTKIKVLNSLARGLPVAATPEAIEGLDVSPGEELLTGGDPASLAEAIVRLMSDAELWERLHDRGRALIRERYTVQTAYALLEEALAGFRAEV